MAGGLIGRVFAEIGADASQLISESKKAQSELNKLGATAMKSSDVFNTSFGDSITMIATLGAQMLSAGVTMKKAWNMGLEGAQISSLQSASKRLATSYGLNMDAIVTAVKKASLNTVDDYTIMRSANAALTMGVTSDVSVLSNLMEIATERSRLFGLTTGEAFDRIVTGIGRQTPRTLYELGFSIKGVTTKEELLTRVLQEGNSELVKQGGLSYDTAAGFQMINTGFGELYEGAKKGMGGFIGQFIDFGYASGQFIDGLQKGKVSGMEFLRMAGGAITTNKTWADVVNQLNTQIDSQVKGMGELHRLEAQQGVSNNMGMGDLRQIEFVQSAIQKQKDSISELNYQNQLQVGLAGDIAKAQEIYDKAMKDAGHSTKKQKIAIEELNQSYESFILSTMQGIGVDSKATMSVAYAFGEIDDASLGAYLAVEELNKQFEKDKDLDKFTKGIEKLKGRIGELEGKDIPIAIRVTYYINGVMWNAASLMGQEGPSIALLNRAQNQLMGPGGMHGGSFIGMQHGGMIPPGFSNDGFPLMVSSGERVDVTPAGNKTVSGDGSSPTYKFYGPVNLKVDKGAEKDFLRNFQQ
jgi:hypothetical protein